MQNSRAARSLIERTGKRAARKSPPGSSQSPGWKPCWHKGLKQFFNQNTEWTALFRRVFYKEISCLYVCGPTSRPSILRNIFSLLNTRFWVEFHVMLLAQSCATLWTVARQAPLSMGFSRQEYWTGLQFPPPGDLPDPRIEPTSLASPALAGGFFTTSAT